MQRGIRLIQGLFLSYIMTGVSLILLSFFLYKMSWGEKKIHIGIVITYILATLIGGFYIGKKVQTKRLLMGLLFGTSYFGIILLANRFLYPGEMILGKNLITVFCMCVGVGVLGSIIS